MKETTLSVLKEIRDLLKSQTKTEIIGVPIKDNLIKIVDDGKLKTSEIISEMKKLFNVYCYLDMDKLDIDFPPVKTKRKFKYIQEADPENANKSANQLEQKDQITLRERLLFELEYFKKEGKHLDVDNWTLCAGSRDRDGDVPRVYWSSDYRNVRVDWCDPDYSDGGLRSRSAVS